MSALETQVGGDHYKSMPIQPMEYSMANGLDACQHTIVKYVSRFRQKGGVQDLEKARHVLDMLIEFERKASAAATAANDNQPARAGHVPPWPAQKPARFNGPLVMQHAPNHPICCGRDDGGCEGCPRV